MQGNKHSWWQFNCNSQILFQNSNKYTIIKKENSINYLGINHNDEIKINKRQSIINKLKTPYIFINSIIQILSKGYKSIYFVSKDKGTCRLSKLSSYSDQKT